MSHDRSEHLGIWIWEAVRLQISISTFSITHTLRFGGRICPGKLLAEANIFILITTLLATFRIEPPAEGELVPEFEAQLVKYVLVPHFFSVYTCAVLSSLMLHATDTKFSLRVVCQRGSSANSCYALRGLLSWLMKLPLVRCSTGCLVSSSLDSLFCAYVASPQIRAAAQSNLIVTLC